MSGFFHANGLLLLAGFRCHEFGSTDQIIGNMVGTIPALHLGFGSFSGTNENGRRSDSPSHAHIGILVANHVGTLRIKSKRIHGLFHETRCRLAASTVFLGRMWAVEKTFYRQPLGGKQLGKPRVAGMNIRLGEIPSPHPTLVGQHGQPEPHVSHAPKALGCTGKQLHTIRIMKVMLVKNNRPVAIKQHKSFGHGYPFFAIRRRTMSNAASKL